jgi:tRNA(Ile2) C34 agmatinyltransferase TiaS
MSLEKLTGPSPFYHCGQQMKRLNWAYKNRHYWRCQKCGRRHLEGAHENKSRKTARENSRNYYYRKVAAGFRKVRGKWIEINNKNPA